MDRTTKRMRKQKFARVGFQVMLFPKIDALLQAKCDNNGTTKTAVINNLITDYVMRDVMKDLDGYMDEIHAIRNMVSKYHTLPDKDKGEMIGDIVDYLDDHSLMEKVKEDIELRQ